MQQNDIDYHDWDEDGYPTSNEYKFEYCEDELEEEEEPGYLWDYDDSEYEINLKKTSRKIKSVKIKEIQKEKKKKHYQKKRRDAAQAREKQRQQYYHYGLSDNFEQESLNLTEDEEE